MAGDWLFTMREDAAVKIAAIKAYAVAGPLTDLCFVKVETDEPGLYGWGEASLPIKSPAVAQAVRDMEALVVGMDAISVERVWQRMYRHSYWRGGPILTSSISGIDQALWDIRGKYLRQPVCALLGGPVRDRVALYANLGLSSDPVELRRRAEAAKALGYTTFKFYPLTAVAATEAPTAVASVIACCEAVRDEIGPDQSFALDFHGRCSAALAVQIEAAIRHTNPMWIEEPTPPENPQALARCAEKFVTPLAAGERLFTRWGFRELLENKLVDIIQPDAANAGGISEMMRIASMAELYGVAFAPHNPNGPVQAMASLHLAAAAPAFTVLEHRHDVADAFAVFANNAPTAGEDGYAVIPTTPGLGIDLDENWLAAHPATPYILESFRADGAVADW